MKEIKAQSECDREKENKAGKQQHHPNGDG